MMLGVQYSLITVSASVLNLKGRMILAGIPLSGIHAKEGGT